MDKRRSRAPSYLPSAAAAMGRASPCAESCSKRPRSAKIIMMITIIVITIEMIMICNSDGKTCSGNIDSSTRPYSAARALSGKFKSCKLPTVDRIGSVLLLMERNVDMDSAFHPCQTHKGS